MRRFVGLRRCGSLREGGRYRPFQQSYTFFFVWKVVSPPKVKGELKLIGALNNWEGRFLLWKGGLGKVCRQV